VSNELPEPLPRSVDQNDGAGRRRAAIRRWPAVLLVAVTVAGAVAVTFWEPMAVYWRQSRARTRLQHRRNAEALDELRVALRHDLQNVETLLLLARTHRRLGNLARVSVLLGRAEALGGSERRIQRERRLALAQAGRLRETEPHLADMLINAGDDGPDICEAYVQGFFANLRNADALRLLDVWERSYPSDPQPIFMRAYLWQSMGHPAQAIALYRKGLDTAPQQTTMRRRLGEALVETGQIDGAETELSLCVKQAPDDPEIRYVLAQCAYARGDLEQARQRLDQTLKLAPGHLDARRLKGQTALALGKPDEALGELEAVVEQRPYDTLAREALGRALLALGRSDEAKGHLDFVAQAEPSISRLNRLLRESIIKPNDAELRYEIGTILFQYGPPEDAAKWMRAALELNPEHAGAHRALAAHFGSREHMANAWFHRRLAGREQWEP
jgi:tetratricopeptide (TPR) repeat protein